MPTASDSSKMFKIVFVILFVCACVNGAKILIPSTQTSVVSDNSNLFISNGINEIPVENELKICMSDACAKETALMRSYMDDSIDSCDDFYQFACGRFIRDMEIPEDKSIQWSFEQVNDKVEQQVQTLLTEESKPNESKPFTLAKQFYKLCLDETTLNVQGENGKNILSKS